jgi:hypothetical protein
VSFVRAVDDEMPNRAPCTVNGDSDLLNRAGCTVKAVSGERLSERVSSLTLTKEKHEGEALLPEGQASEQHSKEKKLRRRKRAKIKIKDLSKRKTAKGLPAHVKAFAFILYEDSLQDEEKLFLFALLDHARTGTTCFPGDRTLANLLGKGPEKIATLRNRLVGEWFTVTGRANSSYLYNLTLLHEKGKASLIPPAAESLPAEKKTWELTDEEKTFIEGMGSEGLANYFCHLYNQHNFLDLERAFLTMFQRDPTNALFEYNPAKNRLGKSMDPLDWRRISRVTEENVGSRLDAVENKYQHTRALLVYVERLVEKRKALPGLPEGLNTFEPEAEEHNYRGPEGDYP